MQNLGLSQESSHRRRSFQGSEDYQKINCSLTSNNRLMNLVRNTAQGTQKRIDTALRGLIAEKTLKILPPARKNAHHEKSEIFEGSTSKNPQTANPLGLPAMLKVDYGSRSPNESKKSIEEDRVLGHTI